MFGTLMGDFVGSTYEFHPIYNRYFDLFSTKYTFTDDSVLTAAIAESFLYQQNIRHTLVKWTMAHRKAGYGKNYFEWALKQKEELNTEIGNSWGNGCLMRNSPSVLLSATLEEALARAKSHCEITHSHAEALQATALYTKWCFMTLEFAKKQAQQQSSNKLLKKNEQALIQERKLFFFDLVHKDLVVFEKLDEYCMSGFKVDAVSTLPRVLAILWESENFEELLRNAVFIGGDCDTNAAIAGCAGEIIFGLTPEFLKDFLAYSQSSGESAQMILPVIAAAYLHSPHKDYFLAQGYLPVIEAILNHENNRVRALEATGI